MLDLIFLATGAAFLYHLRPVPRLPAITCRTTPMMLDNILGGLVVAVLLAYLVVALIPPERF